MDVIDKTQAVSDEIPQAEENTPRRGKAGLRKRKPEVINSKGSRKTAETVEDDLDESSKSELQFHKDQLDATRSKWREHYNVLVSQFLDHSRVPELVQEELPGIIEAFHIKINKKDLSPEQQKLIVKSLLGIDGSTTDFLGMVTKVLDRLKDIGLEPSAISENFAPELISLLTTQEEITKSVPDVEGPSRFYEIRELDNFKGEVSLESFMDCFFVRKRRSVLLEAIGKLIKALEGTSSNLKTLDKIKDAHRKMLTAEVKVAKEEERISARDQARKKIADEKQAKVDKVEQKEKARRDAEEKKREDELKKEEKRKDEERKKEDKRKDDEKKKEEKRLYDEKKKEEKRLIEEQKKEEKRLEELKKAEKKAEEEALKEKSKINLTKFFNVLPKQEEEEKDVVEAMAEEVIADKNSIWKKGLGSIRRFSEWNAERKQEFDDLLKANTTPASNGMSIEFAYNISNDELRTTLKEQLHHLRDTSAAMRSEADGNTVKTSRRVMVKYEDYMLDCYEYRGVFKRRSDRVTAHQPFAKDEELIDYELSSDEELQLEEADSINTKAQDSEEEGSAHESQEDNFVVPDGYLSDEEFGSLDEEDKRGYKQKKGFYNRDGEGSKKATHFYNFIKYKPGEDHSMDELASTLKVVSIGTGFPIQIEREESDNEMNDDFMLDLIRWTHCTMNKLVLIEKLKEKYKTLSKVGIKQKIEDVSTTSIIADPELYYRKNGDLKVYFEELSQLFLNRNEEGDDDISEQGKDDEETAMANQAQDKDKKDKKSKEFTDEMVWELAQSLNSSQEGLSKPKNKIIMEFLKKYPHMAKRTVDRKAKEITMTVYLVDPSLFSNLQVPGEYMEIISREFKARNAVNTKPDYLAEGTELLANLQTPQKDIAKGYLHAGKESTETKVVSSPHVEKLQLSGGKANKENSHQTSMLSFLVTGKAQDLPCESSYPVKESTSTVRIASKKGKLDKENDKLSSNKVSTFFPTKADKDKPETTKPLE